ncbi:hypothetical protein [Kitasatospora sp. NPDC004289]
MKFDQDEPQDVRERRLAEERAAAKVAARERRAAVREERRAARLAAPLDLGWAHVGAVGVAGAMALSAYRGVLEFVWVLAAVMLLVYVLNLAVARSDGEEWPVAVRRAYRSTFGRRRAR